LLAALLSAPVAAAPPVERAEDLINRMSRAVRTLHYDGELVYRQGDQLETMRLLHAADGGNEQERLVTLSGPPREVIRNGRAVTCIFPEQRSVLVEKSRPRKLLAGLPEPVESLAAFYHFRVIGEERIAGRNATVVGIESRDPYRYGYRLWVDRDTALLLGSELRSRAGEPLEQFMFTRVTVVEALAPELLKPTLAGNEYTWFHEPAVEMRGTDTGSWSVAWMPEGFALSEHEKRALVGTGDPVDHLVISDGVASVSVFIERTGDEPRFGPARVGGVNAFSRFANGFQVTAIGEVPEITVQKIANSVRASD
jgi:sigma-E factor negative regulatory protein RseB